MTDKASETPEDLRPLRVDVVLQLAWKFSELGRDGPAVLLGALVAIGSEDDADMIAFFVETLLRRIEAAQGGEHFTGYSAPFLDSYDAEAA
jgi:hypothetical protein